MSSRLYCSAYRVEGLNIIQGFGLKVRSYSFSNIRAVQFGVEFMLFRGGGLEIFGVETRSHSYGSEIWRLNYVMFSI